MSLLKIPAVYYRGGTSKGIFFLQDDLPPTAREAGHARDNLLLRVLGSPDPYGKQIDGLGNASSSTSKAVIIRKSASPAHDIDYLFGQVAIDRPFVDWSGNCGNLTAAAGAFAVRHRLVDNIPANGLCRVRIHQANTGQTLIVHIPMENGEIQEEGDFYLDGVAFPAAEIRVEFLQGDDDAPLFPSGKRIDTLNIPELGAIQVSLVNAGIPTVFMKAADLGLHGTETQDDINSQSDLLNRLETIRAHGALAMRLIPNLEAAKSRAHSPKIVLLAAPAPYTAADGKAISADAIDLLVRAISMGKTHHALMGTAAVATAAAAAVPDTLVSQIAGGARSSIRCGHPSGILAAGASASETRGEWRMEKAIMSRSARVIMEGRVSVPARILNP